MGNPNDPRAGTSSLRKANALGPFQQGGGGKREMIEVHKIMQGTEKAKGENV